MKLMNQWINELHYSFFLIMTNEIFLKWDIISYDLYELTWLRWPSLQRRSCDHIYVLLYKRSQSLLHQVLWSL